HARGGDRASVEPVLVLTGARGKSVTVRATIDQSPPPAGWRRNTKAPAQGGGEVGVAFGVSRFESEGGLKKGVPPIAIAYAVLVAGDKVRLVQVPRDGENHIDVKPLGEAGIGGRAGKRALEVTVDPATVAVSVDGQRASFKWKPDGDADGFIGFMFNGVGYASLAQPAIKAAGSGR